MTPSINKSRRRHLVFLQYGDYREAVLRFRAGGPETYAAQRYSVDFVAGLVAEGDVTVVCIPAPVHDEMLPNGVRAIGLNTPSRLQLVNVLRNLHPTHIAVCAPNIPALIWSAVTVPNVLPFFADSFFGTHGVTKLSHRVLARLLSLKQFPIVANHNVPACLDLVRIGVPPDKVVPWDWPSPNSPNKFEVKRFPGTDRPFNIFFVGLVSEAKGTGDLIRALVELQRLGIKPQLRIAGDGEVTEMKSLVALLGLTECVEFLGRIPNSEVIVRMREHDAVVIPSRPECPEGLPLTIYEALCSRTPLLISDHPMFKQAFRGSPGVKVFTASNPAALARAVRDVAHNAELYESLSENSASAWEQIQVPLKMGELISRWLRGGPEDLAFLRQHSVSSMKYDRRALASSS